ncbi:MAG: acetyl-CoA decarbonylase/synthase complex subunit gamma [Candidatus Bathyarchaeia archaeon]
MKKRVSPIDIHRLLPMTNCKICGEENCMAFAAKLVNREATLDQCPPIMQENYRTAFNQLWEILKPPIKEVSIGGREHVLKIGGKYVLYRHEFTYHNPTAIAVDVTDEMSEDQLLKRVKSIESLTYTYIGQSLRLDAVAIRSVSGDSKTFGKAVMKLSSMTELPLILCSTEPDIMEAGLVSSSERRPLMYAATTRNWKEMAELATMYRCPIVASAPEGLSQLRSLVKTLKDFGCDDIILDPGTFPDDGVAKTVTQFSTLRLTACKYDDELFGYPIMGVPMIVWMEKDHHPDVLKWKEAYLTSMLIVKYADLLIIHSLDGWVVLPNLILRQNIYTDPRKPVAVEPGVRTFGKPDENSPLLMTTNFALTYYTVAADIESFGLNCYLLVVDTEGLSVESAVAGRKLTADKIAEALGHSSMKEKLKHNKMIIPGRAARLSGEVEETTGWKILVGPLDSSGIQKFIHEKWTQT